MLEEECNVALSLAIGGGDFEIEEETSTTEERHIERLRLPNNIEESPPVSTVARDGGDGKGGKRKKLRLSREQLSLLEDRFGAHNTLSPDQKQDLAQRLNLQPRQVEVWFQNRRARTKLKQTDVAYKFLKKYCDRLTSENRRLKRELMELRLAKTGSQLSVELRKAARLSMCSSCQKMVNDEKESTS